MDRTIVYPGSIPLDSDILAVNRNTMAALGGLLRATFGTGTVVDGLVCSPTIPPTMGITVGAGSITSLAPLDATAYGTLPADTTDIIPKMGVNLTATGFTLTAPPVAGQAVNYLIEASLSEYDTAPVVLPYYNASSPAQPYSGPGNSGGAQNTQRLQRVRLQVISGAPAIATFQTTPAPDPGCIGLYVVTVFYNQTYIASGSITAIPTAPFLLTKLPNLTSGYSNMTVIAATQFWVPPMGANRVKLRMVGGGGAGGVGGGGAGGGGAGGGFVEGYYAVTPGNGINCTIGTGGAGSGNAGGASSFGGLAVASGGGGGASGGSGSAGAGSTAAGTGAGIGILLSGGNGGAGLAGGGLLGSGSGGATPFGAGAAPVFGTATSNTTGMAASLPGTGGAGGVGVGGGGAGAPGLIILEW